MRTQKTIKLHPALVEKVEQYMKRRGIKSFSEALSEMIIKATKWEDPTLKTEYSDFMTGVSNDYDPASDQDGDYTFEAWLQRKFAGGWGGDRT